MRQGLDFSEVLRAGAWVADGAMGTRLYEQGVLFSACYEALNLSRPELVKSVHAEYVAAGAEIIETNTFGANGLRLEKHGLSKKVREVNEAGVRLAREVAGAGVFVAGAIGPSGYFLGEASPGDLDLVREKLLEQARALVGAGVDTLWVETMRQTVELQLAVEAALEASGGKVPVVAFASLDDQGHMADGKDARAIAELVKAWGAHAVGVNCSDGPMGVLASVERMIDVGLPVCALPNAGMPHRVDDRLVYVSTPEYFGVYARRMFKLGTRIVGGCCGTTPEHVRRIAAAARMADAADRDDSESLAIDSKARIEVTEQLVRAGGVEPVPLRAKSKLAAKLGKEFVVSVEVNPPIGLDLSPKMEAIALLKKAGVHVVNIADGARAQARMSNLAMAARVQQKTGMETILHVCGRDRNLLASLAHLMGAHELDVRNLVIITGDPPKMGAFPDAMAVYDLDSIGLLKMATRLNHGVDPAGKALGGATSFLLATGGEPAALNYEREIRRLELKKDAGAELVMTQPVYDPKTLERFLDDIKHLELPVLVGLLPLASYRNAEFLHNEVPGMAVPDEVRHRMKLAGTGATAREEGVKIAREMLEAVRDRVAGAYIMPPLERYHLAAEVIDGFLGPVGERARIADG